MAYPCCCSLDACPTVCSGCDAYTADATVTGESPECSITGLSLTRTDCGWAGLGVSPPTRVLLDCIDDAGTIKWKYQIVCDLGPVYKLEFVARTPCPPKGSFTLDKQSGVGDATAQLDLT